MCLLLRHQVGGFVQRQAVDLHELVEHGVTLHRVLAARKDSRIALDTPAAGSQGPRPLADANKLQQVLTNLLANAVKFSFPGTGVVVQLQFEPVAGSAAGHAVVTVTDQGPGIAADELGKLHKPSGRTRVRSTGGEASTGLGLAIARGIVEAMAAR